MVRKAAWWVLFVWLGIAFIAAGWMFGASEPFGHCIHEHKNGHAYQALHEKELLVIKLFARVRLNSVCSAHVANAYQGAITGLSGVAVAFFTATLWWVTWSMVSIANKQRNDLLRSIVAAEQAVAASNRQANAAEKALSTLERGYVFIQELEIDFWPMKKEGGADSAWAQPRGHVTLANWGRTPVTITGILPYGILGDSIPESPDYSGRSETYGDVVLPPSPDKILRKAVSFRVGRTITDEDVECLTRRTKFIVMVCRVRYEDVFGVEHFRGEAKAYDHGAKDFLTFGGKAYNYDRKANPEETPTYEFQRAHGVHRDPM